jgi:YD repeat-containing protein
VYHYEAQHNGGHDHALTGISVRGTDASTGGPTELRIATYGYDATGQAVLSVRGRPRETKDGLTVAGTGIDQIELAFVTRALPFEGRADRHTGEVASRHPGRTVITNSLGQQTEVLHAVIGGHHRLVEMRGAGCADCGPAFMRYGWDPAGRLRRATRLDVAGHALTSDLVDYDEHGRIVRIGRQRHGAAGVPGEVVWTTRYEYADRRYPDGSIALGPRPALVEQPSVVAGQRHTARIAYDLLGRLQSWTEHGRSPLDEQGRVVPGGHAITRTITWRHADVGGVSVLVEIDGPLPNGPSGGPGDSDVTRLHWDPTGQHVVGITRPAQPRMTLTHDPLTGRLLTVASPDGAVERLRYDNDGNLQAIERTTGDRVVDGVAVRRDLLGRIVDAASLAGGASLPAMRQAHDLGGRLQWRADHRGVLHELLHDTEGRLLASRVHAASMHQEERYQHDPWGRVERIDDATGAIRHLLHDAAGRVVETVDPLGRAARYAYDDAGRVGEVTLAAGTGQALSIRRAATIGDARRELRVATGGGTDQLLVATLDRRLRPRGDDPEPRYRPHRAVPRRSGSTHPAAARRRHDRRPRLRRGGPPDRAHRHAAGGQRRHPATGCRTADDTLSLRGRSTGGGAASAPGRSLRIRRRGPPRGPHRAPRLDERGQAHRQRHALPLRRRRPARREQLAGRQRVAVRARRARPGRRLAATRL